MKLVLAGVVTAAALTSATAVAAGPPLTHAQLVARADATCSRFEPLLAAPPGIDARYGEREFDQAWLAIFERQRVALAALRPSSRDRAAWTRLLRTLPPIRDSFRSLTQAIEAGRPVVEWRPLSRRLSNAERAATKAARTIGLRRCFRDTHGG